ncbi:MAG TPA: hypothetical protein VG387_17560 [Rhizomicrobium sp.]|jgi:hypothetical protein|nr:hypothetical protein [Rhizomicrobium sp.]
MADTPHTLIKKIEALPPEQISEVEDFVDSIAAREKSTRTLTSAAKAASGPAFAAVWNNPDDDAYDEL